MTRLELFKMESAIKDAKLELNSAYRRVEFYSIREEELRAEIPSLDQYQLEGRYERIHKVKADRKAAQDSVKYWESELQKRQDKLKLCQTFS